MYEDGALFVSDWSADGRYVLSSRAGQLHEEEGWFGGTDIAYLDLQEGGILQNYLSTQFAELEASFSPNDRWVAYESNESGTMEIYVRPFLPAGGKWQVSDGGGRYPRWSADGTELYYRNDAGVVVAEVDIGGDAFVASRPRQLVSGVFRGGLSGLALEGGTFADYDVAPDGRFVMFLNPEGEEDPGVELVQVVVNWFGELNRLASTR